MSSTGEIEAVITVGSLVEQVELLLAGSGVAESRAEARDLVAVVAGRGRFWPRSHAFAPIDTAVIERAHAAAARRAMGMPFAYAVRRAAFRHLTLKVDERVLIPRQETELLVDLVLRHRGEPGGVAADVATGSGAIALALASEGRFDRIIATDVAADAVGLARENAGSLPETACELDFRVGDLLAPLGGERVDVLVSNPPYLAFDEASQLPSSVRNWEPTYALFSGGQGLEITRRIIADAPALVCSGGLLALEVDSRRALDVTELVASNGAWRNVELYQDLMGRDRFVLARRA